MSIKAGVGMSRHHNPIIAGREAAEQALEKVGIDKPDFVFMFGSSGYDQSSLLGAVREITGGAPLTGCSAAGTINGEDADESNFSVVVTVISSDELHWHNGLATGLRPNHAPLGSKLLKSCYPTFLPTRLAYSSSQTGLQRTSTTFSRGWRRISQTTNFSRSGAGELATTSMRRRQPISTATRRSSPVGSPTRCSRARRKLPGL